MMEPASNRVDMLLHQLNHSGVSNAAVTLANAMARKNINVHLIVVGEKVPSPFLIHENVEIKFLGIARGTGFFSKMLYFIRAYFILSVFFAKQKSRNVFVWGKEFTALAVILRLSLPLPFKLVGVNVTSISEHLKNKHPIIRFILRRIYKSLLSNPDEIIAQSGGMVDDLKNNYNIAPDKISVIAPPLQAKFFDIPVEKSKSDKILFIGKFTDSKNPLLALEIYKRLSDLKNGRVVQDNEYPLPKLIFIGGGELESELKAKIAESGLENNVSLAGKQNDILPYLRDADALIMTSKYEGFGMVLAESIASGVPVISFDCPSGPAGIIIDGVNGYLIPEGNVDLFVKKLDLLLARNWNHQRVSESAGKFHPDIVIKQYMDVIKRQFLRDS